MIGSQYLDGRGLPQTVENRKPIRRRDRVEDQDMSGAPLKKAKECSYASTRERVMKAEEESKHVVAQHIPSRLAKEKTGYQLYHMHRVAEIKQEMRLKHHEAFKRAAKDWSKLPETEKAWYNNVAARKSGMGQGMDGEHATARTIDEVDQVIDGLLLQVDLPQPVVAPPLFPSSDQAGTPFSESTSDKPTLWVCSCGNTGAPEGSCLMCAAFGNAHFM